jgi:hypothetical protein
MRYSRPKSSILWLYIIYLPLYNFHMPNRKASRCGSCGGHDSSKGQTIQKSVPGLQFCTSPLARSPPRPASFSTFSPSSRWSPHIRDLSWLWRLGFGSRFWISEVSLRKSHNPRRECIYFSFCIFIIGIQVQFQEQGYLQRLYAPLGAYRASQERWDSEASAWSQCVLGSRSASLCIVCILGGYMHLNERCYAGSGLTRSYNIFSQRENSIEYNLARLFTHSNIFIPPKVYKCISTKQTHFAIRRR